MAWLIEHIVKHTKGLHSEFAKIAKIRMGILDLRQMPWLRASEGLRLLLSVNVLSAAYVWR